MFGIIFLIGYLFTGDWNAFNALNMTYIGYTPFISMMDEIYVRNMVHRLTGDLSTTYNYKVA